MCQRDKLPKNGKCGSPYGSDECAYRQQVEFSRPQPERLLVEQCASCPKWGQHVVIIPRLISWRQFIKLLESMTEDRRIEVLATFQLTRIKMLITDTPDTHKSRLLRLIPRDLLDEIVTQAPPHTQRVLEKHLSSC